ncbi:MULTISPECIES: ferritin-like domain-containing protein [unclassified Pseudofrankia]|uniref:ferritin-like domain-containing protein n=1 Tax=unclassified Pseudofrankia TaxID=2994372 RepID=UPI0008D94CAF|nr:MULTISPECIES: ferritin-like domain-containing protein [unclassified Pseudofrankia]MDT3438102.1 ferritin-like domain-containing protein [Pseudofrankia sp. BMG5.37]OHV56812.1 aminobenzoate oxygenase [Pseudofrankia sp. BMG5.36]
MEPDTMARLAGNWAVPLGGDALFTWDYSAGTEQMLDLYSRGKQRQWDAELRLDWSHDVDPDNPLGLSDEFVWIAGSPVWERLPDAERVTVRRHLAGWLYSQFLHGEQGALVCSAKVVQSAPDIASKFYGATQVMDEARHVEAFQRMLQTKIKVEYPISTALGGLLETIIGDGRWDITYLGMQVMIEGLALASFSIQRDRMRDPLARALNAYVLQDEARHVAFGRLALRDYYGQLSAAELREREDFAAETCWVLKDRFTGEEMWRNLDHGAEECIAAANRSPAQREFRRRLFSRIVPTLKDINLFGPRMRETLRALGVLGFGKVDGAELSAEDERIADEIAEAELAARRREVSSAVARGAGPADDGEAAE